VKLEPSNGRSGQRPVGSQVAVMCSVRGLNIHQRPGMTWLKEGGNIATTGNVVVSKLDYFDLSMIIYNGTIEDSGVYTCRASHANETKHESFDLNFFEELKFASQLQPINAKAHEDVNISCLVSATNTMHLKVLWQKGYAALTKESQRQYKFLENGQVLQIPKFDPEKDNGNYSCKVVDSRTGAVLNREIEIGSPRKNNRDELCSSLCSSLCGKMYEMPKQQSGLQSLGGETVPEN